MRRPAAASERPRPIQANANGNPGKDQAGIAEALSQLSLERPPPWKVDCLPWRARPTIRVGKRSKTSLESKRKRQYPRPRVISAIKRIAQGIVRAQALLTHRVCPIMQVTEKRLLRASHMKPWRPSDNHARLNNAKAIRLSPHGNALFGLGQVCLLRIPARCWCAGNSHTRFEAIGPSRCIRVGSRSRRSAALLATPLRAHGVSLEPACVIATISRRRGSAEDPQ